jgi:hypothetical protein
MNMNEILSLTVDEVLPSRDEVFENQGIPAGTPVPAHVDELYHKGVDLCADTAECRGVLADISRRKFEDVYDGEGRNDPDSPVADILGQAGHLALFAVTVGPQTNRHIERLFQASDYALGCMLDSVASVVADGLAEVVQNRYRDMLVKQGAPVSESTVLRYSPGYCGWHISGQRKLFKFLRPERIGITLRASFLMEPLKSVSGVLIAGPREIHDFPPDYTCCRQCKTMGCRGRIEALPAE